MSILVKGFGGMNVSYNRIKKSLTVLTAFLLIGLCFVNNRTVCMAADNSDKADLSAIRGFGKNYTVDKDGKFEIEGAMVTAGSVYNITVDGEAIQAWSSGYKSRTWKEKELTKLQEPLIKRNFPIKSSFQDLMG